MASWDALVQNKPAAASGAKEIHERLKFEMRDDRSLTRRNEKMQNLFFENVDFYKTYTRWMIKVRNTFFSRHEEDSCNGRSKKRVWYLPIECLTVGIWNDENDEGMIWDDEGPESAAVRRSKRVSLPKRTAPTKKGRGARGRERGARGGVAQR